MVYPQKRAGFTLVEMSIVLVIIGLVVGGVLVGRELVESGRQRRVITQTNEFKAAIYAYMGKFDSLPGDHGKAAVYFGTACDASAAKCNGDSDGLVEVNYADYTDSEMLRFWQHLSLGGFLPTSFTGTSSPTNCDIGTNVPENAFKAGYSVFHTDTSAGVIASASGGLRLVLMSGKRLTQWCEAGIYSPQSAMGIDIKLDDGKSSTGNVSTYQQAAWRASYLPNCLNAGNDYDLTKTDPGCHLYFVMK